MAWTQHRKELKMQEYGALELYIKGTLSEVPARDTLV